MSNTFVVRESSERKAKLDDKRQNELSNSKENYNLKSSGEEEDFQFGWNMSM